MVLLLAVVWLCLWLFVRAALVFHVLEGLCRRLGILGSVRRLVLCVASLKLRSVLRRLSILVSLRLRLVQVSPIMMMMAMMVIVMWMISPSV